MSTHFQASSTIKPYVTLVITARNDTHGVDFLFRLNMCLRTLYMHLAQHTLAVEILIVEWNPPTDTPRLSEVIALPTCELPLELRIIQVPRCIHETFTTHQAVGLYEFTAKNVGIRRAKADFVLCMNADLIFSKELFDFLAKKKLKSGHVYRCNRCGIHKPPLSFQQESNLAAILHFCEKNVMQRSGKDSRYVNLSTKHIRQLKWIFIPVLRLWAMKAYSQVRYMIKSKVKNDRRAIDFYACGDFTLMHIKDWQDISGYVQLDAYGLHIDTLGLASAIAVGKKQIVLPKACSTYHINHQQLKNAKETILHCVKRPMLNWEAVWPAVDALLSERHALRINPPDWGFAKANFETLYFSQEHKKFITEQH